MTAGGIDELLPAGCGDAGGLLDQDVLAGLQGREGLGVMGDIGAGDVDGVDVGGHEIVDGGDHARGVGPSGGPGGECGAAGGVA